MNAQMIHVGRRVHYKAGYGNISGDGVIYAVHGEPNLEPRRTILGGIGQVIRPGDCNADIVLFDGRVIRGVRQCSFNGVGIGFELLDRIHGQGMIDAALRNAAKVEAEKVLAAAKEAEDFKRAEAARVIDPADAPLFYWNGIKDAKGAKLQKAWYSDIGPSGSVTGKYPPNTISITARDYARFSDKVGACFAIKNDSDMMVDYFDYDRIYVIPSHPLYPKVKAAMEAREAHYAKRRA